MQNSEILLAAVCSSRELFEQAQGYVDTNPFHGLYEPVWKEIQKYYENEKVKQVNYDILKAAVLAKYPQTGEQFVDIIDSLSGQDTTHFENIQAVLQAHAEESLSMTIMNTLASGKKDIARAAMEKFIAPADEKDDLTVYHEFSPEDFEEQYTEKNLLRLLPQKLNIALGGGVPRQTHIGIVARPEIGKTSFVINLAAYFCKQGYRVAYCCNEDSDSAIKRKIYYRFAKSTQITEHTKSEVKNNGYQNLYFFPLIPGIDGLSKLKKIIKRVRPDVLIVDQVRNLYFKTTVEKAGMMHTLEQSSIMMRRLAKENDIVTVSVTQAGNSAEGKRILEIDDVDFSNTGFQAQLDLMICLGKQDRMSPYITLSFPRNKLGAPIQPMTIQVDYATSRLVEEK